MKKFEILPIVLALSATACGATPPPPVDYSPLIAALGDSSDKNPKTVADALIEMQTGLGLPHHPQEPVSTNTGTGEEASAQLPPNWEEKLVNNLIEREKRKNPKFAKCTEEAQVEVEKTSNLTKEYDLRRNTCLTPVGDHCLSKINPKLHTSTFATAPNLEECQNSLGLVENSMLV